VFDIDLGSDFNIGTDAREPYRALVEQGPGRCVATIIGGRPVCGRAGPEQPARLRDQSHKDLITALPRTRGFRP